MTVIITSPENIPRCAFPRSHCIRDPGTINIALDPDWLSRRSRSFQILIKMEIEMAVYINRVGQESSLAIIGDIAAAAQRKLGLRCVNDSCVAAISTPSQRSQR